MTAYKVCMGSEVLRKPFNWLVGSPSDSERFGLLPLAAYKVCMQSESHRKPFNWSVGSPSDSEQFVHLPVTTYTVCMRSEAVRKPFNWPVGSPSESDRSVTLTAYKLRILSEATWSGSVLGSSKLGTILLFKLLYSSELTLPPLLFLSTKKKIRQTNTKVGQIFFVWR